MPVLSRNPLRFPPLWAEARAPAELAALRRHPVWRGERVPRGRGRPVLLVPGFLAGDGTLGTMAGWLSRNGYRPSRAGLRWNVDCAARTVDALEERLERLAERHGTRVAVVGQSRGGSLARLLAVRRPDLVSGIVTLGAPLADQLAVHPFVELQVRAVSRLGQLGLRGLFSRECLDGACCAEVREAAAAPFPSSVGFVSLYSRSDGIVDWRSCLDPDAELVEVRSSHIGMAAHPEVYRQLAMALPRFAPRPRRPARATGDIPARAAAAPA